MIDINERAIYLAQKNIKLNNVKNIKVLESDGFSQIKDDEMFDVVVTNPPIRAGKQVIYNIYNEAFNHLKLSRKIIFSYKQETRGTINYRISNGLVWKL